MAEQPSIVQRARGWLAHILAQPNESMQKTLFVAISLCLVCSILVSATAVVLKPLQVANQRLDRKRNILEAAELLPSKQGLETLFEQRIETRLVELATGKYVEALDPKTYDQREAARDPARSEPVPPEQDIAGIKRRAEYAPVYLVTRDGRTDKIILPVHGYGLWSTMYGYLALEADGETISGITFYDHAETPGLGGEIDNPKWQAKWAGKELFGPQGEPLFQVVKGTVAPAAKQAEHKVDGLAGATLTSNGVTRMIRYWVGAQGFGPFLDKFQQAQGSAHHG